MTQVAQPRRAIHGAARILNLRPDEPLSARDAITRGCEKMRDG